MISRQRNRVAVAALGAGALAYIGFVDPHRPGTVYPPCPFKLLTGWNCPGCGGLRMTHDLLHGDLAAAVADNVFLLLGIPALTTWIVLSRRRGQPVSPRRALAVIVPAALLWTLARNLPDFPLTPSIIPR